MLLLTKWKGARRDIKGRFRSAGPEGSGKADAAGREKQGGDHNPGHSAERKPRGDHPWYRRRQGGDEVPGGMAPVQGGGEGAIREVRGDGDGGGGHGGEDPGAGSGRDLGHCTLVAAVQVNGSPMLYGVEATFFRNDRQGLRILEKLLPKYRAKFGYMEHACWWRVPGKQSETCPVPPPRAVCSHGFVAHVEE